MTTFGHSLTGLAALTLIIPKGATWWQRVTWAIVFIALASVPDWPLPGWGHQQLAISHSLWVNSALCVTLVVLLWKRFIGRSRRAIIIAGALTWLSHLILDTLYGNQPGTAIYWPFSDGLASLPLPWLNTLPHVPPPFEITVVRIFVLEFLTFAPLILLCYGLRRIWLNTGPNPGGGDPVHGAKDIGGTP